MEAKDTTVRIYQKDGTVVLTKNIGMFDDMNILRDVDLNSGVYFAEVVGANISHRARIIIK